MILVIKICLLLQSPLMILPVLDVFFAHFSASGVLAMLQVYLRNGIIARQSDVSMAFLAWSVAYTLVSVPLGLVSNKYFIHVSIALQ